MIEYKELFEFLNNSFVLLLGVALLKAIYQLFKMHIQTNENTKDIQILKDFIGYGKRKKDYD